MMNTKFNWILLFIISCFFNTNAIAKSVDINKAMNIVDKVFALEGMVINNNQKTCIKEQFSTYFKINNFKNKFPNQDFNKFSKAIDKLDLKTLLTKEDISKYPLIMGLGSMSQKCFNN